jgi:hypothetical protein
MSFAQGAPTQPLSLVASNVFVTGSSTTGNAFTVQQLSTGNVFSAQTSTGATAMIINPAGSVGIGTTNPIYFFDAYGILRAGSTLSSSIYLTNSEVKWRGDGTAHFSIFNQNSTFQIRNTSGN